MTNRPFKNLFLFLLLLASRGESSEPFKTFEVKLNGRLRHLELVSVFAEGDAVVALERVGTYPNWSSHLSIWRVKSEPYRDAEIPLPLDAIFYGFAQREGEPLLILVRASQLEIWTRGKEGWALDPKRHSKMDFSFVTPEAGDVTFFSPVIAGESGKKELELLVPSFRGITRWNVTADKLQKKDDLLISPHTYYHSGDHKRPLELPFWVRGTMWLPEAIVGSLDPKGPPLLFFPWMDEVTIFPSGHTHYFRRFTEEERDDAQGYAATVPADLNHDGRTDFVVNKFTGATTSLTAETMLYLTTSTGEIPEKGIPLKPEGNRAGGAIVSDFNRDGFTDLVVASSHFNAWAIVRALLRKTAEIQFSFYLGNEKGMNLDEPVLRREISYRFNLSDAELDGILPTLDGDFNGDGLPDVAYSSDRRGVSILLQKKGNHDFFGEYPTTTIPLTVPRSMAVGDLNGDKRSDIVLYDSRSSGNRTILFLINQGNLLQ